MVSRRLLESLVGPMCFLAEILPEVRLWKKLLSPLLKGWPDSGERDRLFLLRWWSVRYISKSGFHSIFLLLTNGIGQMHSCRAVEVTQPRCYVSEVLRTENSQLHTAALETLAILNTLDSQLVSSGDSLKLHTDSEVAYWAVSAQGSTRSSVVTDLVGHIRQVCRKKSLSLKLERVPEILDVVADARALPIHSE